MECHLHRHKVTKYCLEATKKKKGSYFNSGQDLGANLHSKEADLNVPDLLPLKVVDVFLQLLGDARGVHGGSLEFTFCLLMGESNFHPCFLFRASFEDFVQIKSLFL